MNKSNVIPFLEFNLVNYCNLKCKGCTHFSNLSKEKIDENLNQYIYDLNQLKKLNLNFNYIRFLGGEPLLCKNLDEFILETKKVYDIPIHILTNGILIPTLDEDFIKLLSEKNIHIEISDYELSKSLKDKIFNILDTNNIEYELFPSKKEFRKQLTLKKNNDDINETLKYCPCQESTTLLNGKIARCPITMYIGALNKEFNTEFPTMECLDIYNSTGEEIIKFINEPLELCNYCTYKFAFFKWNPNRKNPKIEDWVITKDERIKWELNNKKDKIKGLFKSSK